MTDTLYQSTTGCTNIQNIEVTTSHSSQVSTAIVECLNTTLDIGDSISINLGYVGNHDKIFQGYVKNIEATESPTGRLYTLTCSDVLVRAIDFFIASSNPNSPLTYSNIDAEDLVKNILALAQLTNYGHDNTHFTFGIHNPVEVNLTSAYDYVRFIADILAWHIYADENGKVWFVDRQPYVMGGDSPDLTIDSDNLLIDAKRTITDKDLRNRVVVYGRGDVYAEAHASSPYLPSGFYKTVVVAAPTVFDDTSMAQAAADRNLTLLNRLTYSASIIVYGDPSLLARKIVTFNESTIGASGDWYVFSATHSFGKSGYTTQCELRK